jgi:hypothetical protein
LAAPVLRAQKEVLFVMHRAIITAAFIVAIGAIAAGGFASAVGAQEPVSQFRVDCWIGMKFGDQPGQLIRGWICERPSIPATKAEPVAATDSPPKPREDKEDVATTSNESNRR